MSLLKYNGSQTMIPGPEVLARVCQKHKFSGPVPDLHNSGFGAKEFVLTILSGDSNAHKDLKITALLLHNIQIYIKYKWILDFKKIHRFVS